MVAKLNNRRLYLTKEAEAAGRAVFSCSTEQETFARNLAKEALCHWYAHAYKCAQLAFRLDQIQSNCEEESSMPGWQIGISKRQDTFARKIAKRALSCWYARAYKHAELQFPLVQIQSNWEEVSSIPGWQTHTGARRNGYVMLISLNGTRKPVNLVLDYAACSTGALTYRHLYQQVRSALHLELKVSLRMVAFRPWYRYVTKSSPCPERLAIPCGDAQCVHLLGTSLLYYCYI